uniref:Uncharacterized protein n=1 Tax=Arundo donax TaxID=35708 RepID=A0A0A8YHD8_ARUDO
MTPSESKKYSQTNEL